VMPTVSFFCFYYPPMARSRSRQIFAHVLAKQGFPVRVLSIANPHGFFNKFMKDTSMPQDPPGVSVDRVYAPNWWALGEVLAQVGLLPDAQMNWVRAVQRHWKEIARDQKGILFGLYPPFADILLARWAKESTGWPLVLDYRDEFLSASEKHPGRQQRKLFALERSALESADVISVASATIKQRLQTRYGIPEERFCVTYNGYDLAYDMACQTVGSDHEGRSDDSVLNVVYAGAISQHQKPEVLCEAYRLLMAKHPELHRRINITFYGPDNYYFRHFFRRHLGQGMRYEGFLPYGKIQRLLPSFDVGFFSLAGDSYDYAMPRKLFDYMIAGLPILAALPDGEASRFVRGLDIGKVTHYSDVDALADNLYRYAVDKDEIGRIRKNIRSVREQYSLQKQVEALSIRVKEMVS